MCHASKQFSWSQFSRMCGIAGFWTKGLRHDDALSALTRMTDAIVHRGPDDAGHWFDHAAGIALGHRRLSIVDLSPSGHQPMISASGRFVIVFNGEIYNFRALRAQEEKRGTRFRGSSDTEVLLALIERCGLGQTLEQCVGMFALALWDTHERTLSLARDRFGEKPLYYGTLPAGLAFGSELKVVRRAPGFAGTLDRNAIAGYLRHRYINAPHSVFEEVRKVEPATIATFASPSSTPVFEKYWSLEDIVVRRTNETVVTTTDEESIEKLDSLLRRSIADQMLADVPLGAFLSGGIDSSLVVALMQAQSTQPVRTFTIGFEEDGFNEAPHAGAVAKHLGTSHTTMFVTAADALALVPRLPAIYDEPFADSSQIPTTLVAALARKHVTVALSGDGGDELFGGYSRYGRTMGIWNRIRRVPAPMRRVAAGVVTAIEAPRWDTAFRSLGLTSQRYSGDRMHTLASLLGARTAPALYGTMVSSWRNPFALVRGSVEHDAQTSHVAPRCDDLLASMMFRDQHTYLPGNIMTKVDRAAMAASLESRAPLLDHRVAEFAWGLSGHQWWRDGRGKWILRTLLDRYVPRTLVDRPKKGFSVPYAAWLRGPLRDWADDLLSADALSRDNLFDAAPIASRWQLHRSARQDHARALWPVLMLQAWRSYQS